MQRIGFLGFLLVILVGGVAQAAATTQPFFPIMAWGGVPDDPAAVAKMHDCGINVVGPAPAKYLDACQAAGIKLLIYDERARNFGADRAAAEKGVAPLIEQTAKHPAAIGYFLIDEPSATLFPGLANQIAPIHKLAPGMIPFVNLLPNYGTPDQFGTKTYPEYLESFVKTCHPSILSYDHYALMEDGTLRDGYFQNLEQMRRVALEHKIPFWNVVLAVGSLDYRIPTQADFAFQAYTTLACGGRGIAYFLYLNPLVGNYRGAPIDQFGHETETWPRMRYVNLQVLAVAPTMLKLRSDDVYHIGEVPKGCHGPGKSSLIKNISGGNFLVGEFTHENGSRYVLIVNKDLKRSHPVVDVAYTKPPKKVVVQLPYAANMETEFVGEQAWIAPGSGALLRLE